MNWKSPPAATVKNLSELPYFGKVEPFDIPTAENLRKDSFKRAVRENVSQPKQEVVWEPIPNSSQVLALTSPAQITLYHGARGPGKTAAQLMRFRARVGIGYGKYWRGIIFDREFKNLADLVAQSKKLFSMFDDGAIFMSSNTEYKWVWPTGEELLFRHVKKKDDYDAFHGHEYPFIGWNELTKQPTSELFDKFMSVNRSSFLPEKHSPPGTLLPAIPLEVFATSNPMGVGHNWVKKKFIDVAANGQLVRTETRFYDHVNKIEKVVVRTQVAIFGSFYENPYIDDVYRANMIEMCQRDPHLAEAWIKGNWNVSSGGAVDDIWEPKAHILPRSPIPEGWRIDRSFDWGSSHPFATVWWAEANGEEFRLSNGQTFCPPRGSLIAIADYYGTHAIGTNQGLRLSAREVAEGIKSKEAFMRAGGWIVGEVYPGPADNQIRNVTESDTDTIEFKMNKEGVRWKESDKGKGSRVNGLQLFRDRLVAAVRHEQPAVYFMDNCKACLEIIPHLPRDDDNPEDIDTDAEDHIWDAVRYRILAGNNKWAAKVPVAWAT